MEPNPPEHRVFPLFFFPVFVLGAFLLFNQPVVQGHVKRVFEVPQGKILYFTEVEPDGEHYLSLKCFNRTIPLFNTGSPKEVGAFIGVDLAQSKKLHSCELEKEDKMGTRIKTNFWVKVVDGAFRTQELTVPSAMVDLNPPTLKQVNQEKKDVDQLWSHSNPEKLWEGDFIVPINGEARGSFGLRRVFNGQPRNPHTGEDFSASLGENVFSSNRGIVKLVGDHFFSGKSIFIDHGVGVYTMYFHLSEILVGEGEIIGKGKIIGKVGSTGRATGPHLHWGLRINNTRVDPLSITRFSLDPPSK
ncbi:MAG TPA: M23 family metallopeptidase [Nitrospiria bacterium]|jgi:hypothetical protein